MGVSVGIQKDIPTLLTVVGALIGGFLARNLGFSVGSGFWGSLLTATLGAVVLLVLIRLVNK